MGDALELQAIEKNQQAHDLRQKLTARLKDVGQRMDEVMKELVEAEMAISELEVRSRESLREIRLVVAPTAEARR